MSMQIAAEPTNSIDRRRFERFEVQPMYTAVAVRRMSEGEYGLEGHAYDVSEGGIQFELDEAITPGEAVNIQIMLPEWAQGDGGPGRAVFAVGRVIWLDDDGVDGPVRMAMAFTRFCRVGDRERLIKSLSAGRYRRAA